MSNASELRQAVIEQYWVVIQKFIVTVELLYDQAENDFVQCQTKMGAFASRICSEVKQIFWFKRYFKDITAAVDIYYMSPLMNVKKF